MKKIKVLNTVNFSGCEDSIERLSKIAIVKSVKPQRKEV